MRIEKGCFLGPDGRPMGHWVYMLLCQDGDGPVYVKVGISSSPTQRFAAIANNCGVTPRVHCFIHVPNRRVAGEIERALLKAFDEWRTTGEWLRVPVSEQPKFNAAWRPVVGEFRRFGWPMRWQKVSAQKLLAAIAARGQYYRHRWRQAGAAGRDAMTAIARDRTRR